MMSDDKEENSYNYSQKSNLVNEKSVNNSKIQGKRLLFLIFAIFLSITLLWMIFELIFIPDPYGIIAIILTFGWLPALFWWLFLRKK